MISPLELRIALRYLTSRRSSRFLSFITVIAAGGVTVGTQTVAGLAIGATTTVDIPWNTAGATTNGHILIATQKLPDNVSTNNSIAIPITVQPPPDVAVTGDYYLDAYEACVVRAAETGAVFVHAYDQAEVVAGQGTLALELIEQVDGLDTVLVAIGGGGIQPMRARWERALQRLDEEGPRIRRELDGGRERRRQRPGQYPKRRLTERVREEVGGQVPDTLVDDVDDVALSPLFQLPGEPEQEGQEDRRHDRDLPPVPVPLVERDVVNTRAARQDRRHPPDDDGQDKRHECPSRGPPDPSQRGVFHRRVLTWGRTPATSTAG